MCPRVLARACACVCVLLLFGCVCLSGRVLGVCGVCAMHNVCAVHSQPVCVCCACAVSGVCSFSFTPSRRKASVMMMTKMNCIYYCVYHLDHASYYYTFSFFTSFFTSVFTSVFTSFLTSFFGFCRQFDLPLCRFFGFFSSSSSSIARCGKFDLTLFFLTSFWRTY